MEVREERAGDEEAIREVHCEAFGGDLEARLVDLLRARGRVVTSLVALVEGNIVGHVLLSPVTIDGNASTRALGLALVSRNTTRALGSVPPSHSASTTNMA